MDRGLFKFPILTLALALSGCAVKLFNPYGTSKALNLTRSFALSSISPASGTTAGGTTITLTGTGFVSGSSFGIQIGNAVCAASTWVSFTSATCVTPAQSAGTYSVTLTNGDGQSSTLVSAFTYVVPTAIKLAARGYTTCALMSDQTVECWGENIYGQLGIGTKNYSATPVRVSGLTGATDLSVGFDHACAVVSGGGVKCWGRNSNGQLGNGSTTDSLTPVSVSGLGGTALKVAAGANHSCAVLSASPWIQCWGVNGLSQLGNAGAGGSSSVPVNVSLGAMPVTAAPVDISTGFDHTCVIDGSASRNVWCWGRNNQYQLGNGSIVNSSSAVKIGTISAVQLSLNFHFSCAVSNAGTVWCWGSGSQGSFGSNSGTSFTVPTQSGNKGLNGSQVTTAVSMGNSIVSGCAVLADHSVTCWGSNFRGALGNGSSSVTFNGVTFNHPSLSNISQIVGGEMHMCALTLAGSVQCWGDNALGSVGVGMQGGLDPQVPVSVLGINTAAQIRSSPGDDWTCARLSNGDVYCWGVTQYGLDGSGTVWQMEAATPVQVPRASMGSAVDLSVGNTNACIVNSSGQVWCWGIDGNYMLSAGNTFNPTGPVQQAGITGAVKVRVGLAHICVALNATPYVKCWGTNTEGELGNGNNTSTFTPQTVGGFTSTPTLIGGSENSTCATIGASPYLNCWGEDTYGELGDNSGSNSNVPVGATAVGLAAAPIDLSSNGRYGICAVTSTGGMKCWGGNTNNWSQSWSNFLLGGMLGDGTQTDRWTAVSAGYPSAISGAAGVGGGTYAMCAVFNPGASGTAECWGVNNFGQAGATPGDNAYSRQTLPGSGYVSVWGGENSMCALMNSNAVQCWGDGSGGQLGDGVFRHKNTPQAVAFL